MEERRATGPGTPPPPPPVPVATTSETSAPQANWTSSVGEAIPSSPPGPPADQLTPPSSLPLLWLQARDPYWLYASWNFTWAERQRQLGEAAQGPLILRVYQDSVAGTPLIENPLTPLFQHEFVYTGRAGIRYVAQLGYYHATQGLWIPLCESASVQTPPDAPTEDKTTRFMTLPLETPLTAMSSAKLVEIGRDTTAKDYISTDRASGLPAEVTALETFLDSWTLAQEMAMEQMMAAYIKQVASMDSLALVERARGRKELEAPSPADVPSSLSFPAVPIPGALEISSPAGPLPGALKRPDFWFNIQAELVIYGATEPDAQVTLGGRNIPLRSDGTFSVRFALPDGTYELEAIAIKADNSETRRARLQFRRETNYTGAVAAPPQDPELKAPNPI